MGNGDRCKKICNRMTHISQPLAVDEFQFSDRALLLANSCWTDARYVAVAASSFVGTVKNCEIVLMIDA